MALTRSNKEYNTFVRGIITEGTPIAFPENASIDEKNFELDINGSRTRRLGMNVENNGFTQLKISDSINKSPNNIENQYVSTFVWRRAGGNNLFNILVIQVGNQIYFYNTNAAPITGNLINGGIPITVDGDPTKPMSFTDLFGKLVISHNQQGFLLINLENNNLVIEPRTLQVRDIWGIDDGLETLERPRTLTDDHRYNLINQGWGGKNIDNRSEDSLFQSFFQSANRLGLGGLYPSNADILEELRSPRVDTGEIIFGESLLKEGRSINTESARGQIIIDLFKRGDSRRFLTGPLSLNEVTNPLIINAGLRGDDLVGTLFEFRFLFSNVFDSEGREIQPLDVPKDISSGGVSRVASYGGRCWYALSEANSPEDSDSRSPSYAGGLVYSQIIENNNSFSKCHEEADPTDPDVGGPVATDGGFLYVAGIKEILHMEPFRDSLVLFADNSIFSISGREDIFNPTEVRVTKISDFGVSSGRSVVNTGSELYYWGDSGIFALRTDPVTAQLTSTNISEETISELYFNIPFSSRQNASGIFDPISRKIRWLYKDIDNQVLTNTPLSFGNKELIFDTVLSAFTINEINISNDTGEYFLHDLFLIPNFDINISNEAVTVNGETVTVNGETVTTPITQQVDTDLTNTVRYITSRISESDLNLGISDYSNTQFLDWDTIDAEAFLTTGYDNLGDTQREKQAQWLTINLGSNLPDFSDGSFPSNKFFTSLPYPVEITEEIVSNIVNEISGKAITRPLDNLNTNFLLGEIILRQPLKSIISDEESINATFTLDTIILRSILQSYNIDPENLNADFSLGNIILNQVLIRYQNYPEENIDSTFTLTGATLTDA